MKKHLIIALAGVMVLAIAFPALAAANVGGVMNFGYNYDLTNMHPTAPEANWNMDLTGNVSNNVSYNVALGDQDDDAGAPMPWFPLTVAEASIQANNTPIGNVKLGAFDQNFGELNDAYWAPDFPNPFGQVNPLNVQINNQLAGINMTAGAQFDTNGDLAAAGAVAEVKPVQDLDVTAGVMTDGSFASPKVGYAVNYTGIDNTNLGLVGNIQEHEMIGSAAYQLMPAITVSGSYGVNVNGISSSDWLANQAIIEADLALNNGLSAGVSHEVDNSGVTRITDIYGDYNWQMAQGLAVDFSADHTITNGAPATTFGATANVSL